MARLFNIYFTWDDALFSAIVSVRLNSLTPEYLLGNLDSEVLQKLPGICIVSEPSGELRFQNSPAHHSPELMNAVIQSLAAHLHESEALR